MFIRYFTLLFVILSVNLGSSFVPTSHNTASAQVVPTIDITRHPTDVNNVALPESVPSGTRLRWTVNFGNISASTLDLTPPSNQFAVCYSTDGGTTIETIDVTLFGTSLAAPVTFQANSSTPVSSATFDYNLCTLAPASTIASTDGTPMNFTTLNSAYDATSISTSAITADANNFKHVPTVDPIDIPPSVTTVVRTSPFRTNQPTVTYDVTITGRHDPSSVGIDDFILIDRVDLSSLATISLGAFPANAGTTLNTTYSVTATLNDPTTSIPTNDIITLATLGSTAFTITDGAETVTNNNLRIFNNTAPAIVTFNNHAIGSTTAPVVRRVNTSPVSDGSDLSWTITYPDVANIPIDTSTVSNNDFRLVDESGNPLSLASGILPLTVAISGDVITVTADNATDNGINNQIVALGVAPDPTFNIASDFGTTVTSPTIPATAAVRYIVNNTPPPVVPPPVIPPVGPVIPPPVVVPVVPVVVPPTIVEHTEELIEDFVNHQAIQVLTAIPPLQLRASRATIPNRGIDNRTQSFSADITPTHSIIDYTGNFVSDIFGDSDFLGDGMELWTNMSYSVSDFNTGSKTTSFFSTTGIDFVSDSGLVWGFLLQLDLSDQSGESVQFSGQSTPSTSNIESLGWLGGYYAIYDFGSFSLDGKVALGGSDVQISPLGSSGYTDEYSTNRLLLSSGLTRSGYNGYNQATALASDDWELVPNANYTYYIEGSDAYQDSSGTSVSGMTNNQIASNKYKLNRLTFGQTITREYDYHDDTLIPTFGLSAIFESSTTTNKNSIENNLKSRVDARVLYTGHTGIDWNANTYLEGLGTDNTTYGLSLGLNINY